MSNLLGRFRRWMALPCKAASTLLIVTALAPIALAEPVNLALRKPATASSIENDEHNAAQANDGDAETRWCADDEPEGRPEWWQVDLQTPAVVTGCQIRWPYDGKRYRYSVEGSADQKHWQMLSDQTATDRTSQTHDLKFEKATSARFIRITVTAVDEGCWASICEVKIFGE